MVFYEELTKELTAVLWPCLLLQFSYFYSYNYTKPNKCEQKSTLFYEKMLHILIFWFLSVNWIG